MHLYLLKGAVVNIVWTKLRKMHLSLSEYGGQTTIAINNAYQMFDLLFKRAILPFRQKLSIR